MSTTDDLPESGIADYGIYYMRTPTNGSIDSCQSGHCRLLSCNRDSAVPDLWLQCSLISFT